MRFGERSLVNTPDVPEMIIDVHPDEDDFNADVEILDTESVE